MSTRDRNSDSGRLGGPSSSVRANSETYDLDFGISTIADENANGGWRKTDKPVGGPAPRDKYTYGSAEAE
jgi:hypothetical protein